MHRFMGSLDSPLCRRMLRLPYQPVSNKDTHLADAVPKC